MHRLALASALLVPALFGLGGCGPIANAFDSPDATATADDALDGAAVCDDAALHPVVSGPPPPPPPGTAPRILGLSAVNHTAFNSELDETLDGVLIEFATERALSCELTVSSMNGVLLQTDTSIGTSGPVFESGFTTANPTPFRFEVAVTCIGAGDTSVREVANTVAHTWEHRAALADAPISLDRVLITRKTANLVWPSSPLSCVEVRDEDGAANFLEACVFAINADSAPLCARNPDACLDPFIGEFVKIRGRATPLGNGRYRITMTAQGPSEARPSL